MKTIIDLQTSADELAAAYDADGFGDMVFDPAMTPENIIDFISLHKGRAYSSALLDLALQYPRRSHFDTNTLLSIFADDSGALSDLIGALSEIPGLGMLSREQLEALATSESKMVSGHAENALTSLDIGDSDPDTIAENLTILLAVDDPTEDQYRYCAIAASHPKTPIRILEVMARRGDTLAKIVRLRADWQGRPDALDWRKS